MDMGWKRLIYDVVPMVQHLKTTELGRVGRACQQIHVNFIYADLHVPSQVPSVDLPRVSPECYSSSVLIGNKRIGWHFMQSIRFLERITVPLL